MGQQATAEQYEAAIRHCERVFAKNKSRMWVLKILREQLKKATENAEPET